MHMCQNCTTGKVDQAQIDISVLCRVWSLVHQSSKIEEIFTCASAPAEPLCPQLLYVAWPVESSSSILRHTELTFSAHCTPYTAVARWPSHSAGVTSACRTPFQSPTSRP
eukprot:1048147-Pelagomonas_calceolata.AAC.1